LHATRRKVLKRVLRDEHERNQAGVDDEADGAGTNDRLKAVER
jgi:hypothetical protein